MKKVKPTVLYLFYFKYLIQYSVIPVLICNYVYNYAIMIYYSQYLLFFYILINLLNGE